MDLEQARLAVTLLSARFKRAETATTAYIYGSGSYAVIVHRVGEDVILPDHWSVQLMLTLLEGSIYNATR